MNSEVDGAGPGSGVYKAGPGSDSGDTGSGSGDTGSDTGDPGPHGVNLPALRGHNTALVLDLLRRSGAVGISRLELAARTGLTPQAVSKITARLRGEGLVADAGRRASTGGKPSTLLRLVPEAGHAIGVHLDRDEITAVLVDLRGTVVAERRAPLDLGAGAEPVLGAVAGAVAEVLPNGTGAAPLGVGVALPGPLDHRRGVLGRVTGFPEWEGFALRDVLERRLGLPVTVDKDTNAAALGLALGLGGAVVPAYGSFAYLHLGTGLGAGLVLGGALYRGARTGAGEFGHQVIDLDGTPCGCGRRGCVEALCLAAVGRGAPEEAARVLGTAAANLVGLLDIDLVLLGGRTVTAYEEIFVQGVASVMGAPGIPVTLAPGGPRATAEGAAQLVLAPVFGRESAERAGPARVR
ncbi:ROK family protein [Streptomyces sp. NPDC058001]|uniref:ROK family transcriptional regulator n=1 Tax=Streptomyces sp. NPDC058001 TaxID=3346300 RepID=UPI0036E3DFD1